MPGMGIVELFVIFLLILVLFGPKELPKIAQALARLIYEMKRIFQRLEREWNLMSEKDISKDQDLKKSSEFH